MDENRITSFPPIIDRNCKALALGTMPGAESLRQRRYYAYERNHFWSIIFSLYGLEKPTDYDERVRFLLTHRIALWDVLASCERKTSADSDILNPKPNEIAELLAAHPRIEAVFLNGKGAARLFQKFITPGLNRAYHIEVLPSTSPAYAVPFEKKLEGWRKLLEFSSTLM